MSDPSSSTLAERWRSGDQAAATELYQRYVRRLSLLVGLNLSSGLSPRVGTSDICQSAFKSMFRGLREGRFQFEDDAEVWKLLVTITLNKIRNRVRFERAPKRDHRRDRILDDPHDFDDYRVGCLSRVPDSTEVREFESTLEAALSLMDKDDAQLLRLRLEGRTQREIAECLGITDRTVRRRLERIRDQLKHSMGAILTGTS